jgi:uncharacterized protein YegP (UPF0339 family)
MVTPVTAMEADGMAAKFEVVPSGSGYRWVLKSQGRTLATSESYSRRALAEKAITSFRMAAVNAPVVDTTPTRAKTTTGKVARVTGRTVAKAVVKGGRAVEKVEQAAAKATKRAVKKTAKAVETVVGATSGSKGKKGPGKKSQRR